MTDKLQSFSYCTQVALALQELDALDKGAVTDKLQSPSYCTQVEALKCTERPQKHRTGC